MEYLKYGFINSYYVKGSLEYEADKYSSEMIKLYYQ